MFVNTKPSHFNWCFFIHSFQIPFYPLKCFSRPGSSCENRVLTKKKAWITGKNNRSSIFVPFRPLPLVPGLATVRESSVLHYSSTLSATFVIPTATFCCQIHSFCALTTQGSSQEQGQELEAGQLLRCISHTPLYNLQSWLLVLPSVPFV